MVTAAAGSPPRDLCSRVARMTKGFFPCSPVVASASTVSCPCASSFHHCHSSGGCSPRHTDASSSGLPLCTRPSHISTRFTPHSIVPVSAPLCRCRPPPLDRATDCFHPSLLWLNNPPSLSPLVNCRRGSCGCCGINHLLSVPESDEPLAVVPSSAFKRSMDQQHKHKHIKQLFIRLPVQTSSTTTLLLCDFSFKTSLYH